MHGRINIPEYMPTYQSWVTTMYTQADGSYREAWKNENSLGRLLSGGKLSGTSIDATMKPNVRVDRQSLTREVRQVFVDLNRLEEWK